MALRRLSFDSSTLTDLGENDDEAEKEERRSKSLPNSSGTTLASSVVDLTQEEISTQIDQCLKLNAENKISDKNAFQLKMIDFLVFALKKQNPKFSNLQMASACLDVSGKIYGFRVDKVHSDLLKIVGARGEKRPHENEEEHVYLQDANGNVISQPRKKRRRKHNFVVTAEALKGNLETYNPLSLINRQIDVQTSDCLHQAFLPKHANQGVSLNLYNDVLLDRISCIEYDYSSYLIRKLEDYTTSELCPSFANFKFLGWSVEDEPTDTSDMHESNGSIGDYHFNMDDPIADDSKDLAIMNYRDDEDERFDSTAQNSQDQQPLVDFQDIITNNPDPDANYEYSYIQDNHSIHLVRPSHWRVHIKKDVRYRGLDRSPKKARRKKDIELKFNQETKEEADTRFVLASKPLKFKKATYMCWSEDHSILPLFMHYDKNRFFSYFTSDKKATVLDTHGKIENKEEDIRESHQDDNLDMSNFGNDFQHNDDCNLHNDDQENQLDLSFGFPNSEPPSQQPSQEAFVGENLVTLPKLTENIFIPCSQRAKKIDMRQLKKSIHHILQNQDTKEFSQLYKELPTKLSKANAQSLSPGLAFMSLLHVTHEKTLKLKSHSNYADLTITACDKVQK